MLVNINILINLQVRCPDCDGGFYHGMAYGTGFTTITKTTNSIGGGYYSGTGTTRKYQLSLLTTNTWQRSTADASGTPPATAGAVPQALHDSLLTPAKIPCCGKYTPIQEPVVVRTGRYRFGFNGQELDNEVTGVIGSHYTAEFWEYDSRLGRRWNLDPKPDATISQYSCFANNPITYKDQFGDTLRGSSVHNAQEMLGEMKGIFGDNSEIFNKYFKIGEDEKTFNKIESRVDFNKWLHGKGEYKGKGSGFTEEQIALANGLMKMINAGYSIDVSFDDNLGGSYKGTGKLTGSVVVGSSAILGSVTLSRTSIFIHELLGEAFVAANTGDCQFLVKREEAMVTKYGSISEAYKKDPILRIMNLQIIQAENIYNQMGPHGFLRFGGHNLLPVDASKIGSIPASFSSSFYVQGDWLWEYVNN